MKYDYLVVGAGMYGATFAHLMKKAGRSVLVIDKRSHIGGNCYSEKNHGIEVHKYGAHIFHTSNKDVWEFVNQFAFFRPFINSPVVSYKGKLYSLPFNMNTFYQLWGVTTPQEAKARIAKECAEFAHITQPANMEEQALMLAGREIYEIFIKGYSEKQWGIKASEIPAFVIKRLPFRFTFDNNYFNDTYQGIPAEGYTAMIRNMLEGIEVRLNTDYLSDKTAYKTLAGKVIFTGQIDRYFNYCFGALGYRSLRFEHRFLESINNYQGSAVFNYTDAEVPYTRVIEHKHFVSGVQQGTIVTWEYPEEWKKGSEPFYPVNSKENQLLLEKYKALAANEKNVIFGGRLGEYKYYDMDKVIEEVFLKITE